jgi:hypothetical protein
VSTVQGKKSVYGIRLTAYGKKALVEGLMSCRVEELKRIAKFELLLLTL